MFVEVQETHVSLPGPGTIYLSQTAECRGDHLEHYLNLEDAMARWQTDKTPRQWRTHFHVPVFLEDLGPILASEYDWRFVIPALGPLAATIT